MAIHKRLALLAVVVAAPAYADKPQIQWNPDYDFSAVGTYQWQAPPGASLEEVDPFLHRRIITALNQELEEAGLTEADSDPDAYVTYYGSKSTEVRLETDAYGYAFGGYGMGGWGHYGYGMGGPVSSTTRVVEYDEGTLVVDIWDAGNRELVWRGSVSGILISDDPEKTQKNVVKAIESMGKQAAKLRKKREQERREESS
jgi:hypothetical protein